MNDYTVATYGDKIADVYDEMYPMRADVGATVEALAKLAGDGPALELGIGTGRVALPLAARGVEVHGIDASEAIVAQMRAKPDGNDIPVTIGDFSEFTISADRQLKRFNLIYVVFNTLFQATSQEAQVQCFQSVAAHLTDEGVFLVEAFVPDQTRFTRNQNISAGRVESGLVSVDISRHDPVNQLVQSQHLFVSESGVKLYPVQVRYSWPSELDLMAQLAGMRLRERWGDWYGAPFTASSEYHISIYEKVP
ncbi:MAG: class I SAM-dependent methyltransferase [Chloroflexi bacterium]|nr:class I SAM-dependent methyltransferase [Chloroflexota bacterium]